MNPTKNPKTKVNEEEILPLLHRLLSPHFREPLIIKSAGGAGNHHTFFLSHAEGRAFVRVEAGPEGDTHLEVESRVLQAVARTGTAVPEVYFTDASRHKAPFGVQVVTLFDHPDLGQLHRQGLLSLPKTAQAIGAAIARWQSVPTKNFGPFKDGPDDGLLVGHHTSYESYYNLHLERHLEILVSHHFLSSDEADRLRSTLAAHNSKLRLSESVLVHKDLALWNIIGTQDHIEAFIDWDDAIGGDPTDDLSLLACFYPIEIVSEAVKSYSQNRSIPQNFDARFHLHLIRNLLVKAVIRAQGGIFDLPAGASFILKAGESGQDLKTYTHQRLASACRCLAEDLPYTAL